MITRTTEGALEDNAEVDQGVLVCGAKSNYLFI